MTWIVRLLSLSRSESHHHLQSKAAAIQIQMSRYPDIQIQMSVCDSVLLILSICAAFRDCQSKLKLFWAEACISHKGIYGNQHQIVMASEAERTATFLALINLSVTPCF